VRRQSEAATTLWIQRYFTRGIQSGVALRLPPHSKFENKAAGRPPELCDWRPEGIVQDLVLCCLALNLIEFETLVLVDALAGAVVDVEVELLKSASTFQ
jgi:hypothetical protein